MLLELDVLVVLKIGLLELLDVIVVLNIGTLLELLDVTVVLKSGGSGTSGC